MQSVLAITEALRGSSSISGKLTDHGAGAGDFQNELAVEDFHLAFGNNVHGLAGISGPENILPGRERRGFFVVKQIEK